MTARPLGIALATLLLAGCAPAAHPPASAGGAADAEAIRGVIVVAGTAAEATPTVVPDSGVALRIQGPLAGELRSLAGATVAVNGAVSGEGLLRTLSAESYEILEINGERPVVGTVLSGGRLAAGSDTLRLVGGAAMAAGSRVWVVGRREGDALRVSSWGAIAR